MGNLARTVLKTDIFYTASAQDGDAEADVVQQAAQVQKPAEYTGEHHDRADDPFML